MKENITRLLAQCSQCHRAVEVEDMTGYICDSCRDALMHEPAKVEWEGDENDAG